MKPAGFDNTMLSVLLNPKCRIPIDPNTSAPLTLPKKRAEFLVATIQKEKRKIIIPTPASAEVLTAIGPDAQAYYDIIARNRLFEVAAFDQRAAIELALLNRDVFSGSDPKNSGEPYQKIKIDRQIIAILKSRGAEEIYTDDINLSNRAKLCGLVPVRLVDLPLPPDEKQMKFEFEPHEEIPEPEPDPSSPKPQPSGEVQATRA